MHARSIKMHNITPNDMTTLDWIEIPPEELHRVDFQEGDAAEQWWRIVAEMQCSSCGAYQAADSDPVNDKETATKLAVKLFNDAGWRVDDAGNVLCADCQANNH